MVKFPLIELLDKRSLILHFSWMNIKLRFKGSYLGLIWAGLEPLLMFLILFVVFSSIREIPKEDFGIYLITGVLFYHLFSRGTSTGLGSLKENSSILKSFKIKKELFPVIATTTTCILLFVEVGVLFGLMPVFEFTPGWNIVFLPMLLILFLSLVLGINYILSILYVYVKDVKPFWTIFVYALLFVSPIFWYTSEVEGILLNIQQINPFGQLVEMAHKIIVFNENPSLLEWTSTTIIIFVILIIGFIMFKKLENNTVEQI
ncbi:MAG: ABC transporter permease [Nitrosopumilus sp.]|nr:ABC transporter permease [Nitrosopumilus sp.]MDH3825613.1 ABC transporter permease [Nitrosopumilus sp.]